MLLTKDWDCFPLLSTAYSPLSASHPSTISTQIKYLLWVARLREPTWFTTQLSLGGEMVPVLPKPF